MTKEEQATLKEMVIGGLYTDGEHHKQWYLGQILEALGGVGPGDQDRECEACGRWEKLYSDGSGTICECEEPEWYTHTWVEGIPP